MIPEKIFDTDHYFCNYTPHFVFLKWGYEIDSSKALTIVEFKVRLLVNLIGKIK